MVQHFKMLHHELLALVTETKRNEPITGRHTPFNAVPCTSGIPVAIGS